MGARVKIHWEHGGQGEGLALANALEAALRSGAVVLRVAEGRVLERWDQRYRFGIPYRHLGTARWAATLRGGGWTVEPLGRATRLAVGPDATVEASTAGIAVIDGARRAAIRTDALTGISCARGWLTLLTLDGPEVVPLPYRPGARAVRHLLTSAVLGVV
jgi:hypothetical protein